MNKNKMLVTGGTGFLGSALVKKLICEGHYVRVLDNNIRGVMRRLEEVKDDIEFIEVDVRDSEKVKKAVKGMDTVFHLAAINGTEFFYDEPELVLDVSLRGMLNVIDACKVNNIYELFVASSSEVYQSPPYIPTDEKVPLSIPDVINPRYSYGCGKLTSELIAINYSRSFFKRVIIFRPHNVYGPDMGWEHVLPQFTLQAVDAIQKHPRGPVPFKVRGDGRNTRSFIHVDDFTNGLLLLLEKGLHHNIYNIGTEEEVSIAEAARQILLYFGREIEYEYIQADKGAALRRCPDITKLKSLGFQPKIDFSSGLPSLIKWYIKNSSLKPDFGLNLKNLETNLELECE